MVNCPDKVTAIVRRGSDPATEEEVLVNSDHIVSIAGDANGSPSTSMVLAIPSG